MVGKGRGMEEKTLEKLKRGELGSEGREFRVGKSFVAETNPAVLGVAALAELDERGSWEEEEERGGRGDKCCQ